MHFTPATAPIGKNKGQRNENTEHIIALKRSSAEANDTLRYHW